MIASVVSLGPLHLLLYPFWLPVRLLPVPWFVATLSSFLALSSFCVAYLYFGRYADTAEPPFGHGGGSVDAGGGEGDGKSGEGPELRIEI